MPDSPKTVFISYRHEISPLIARAVAAYLRRDNYQVVLNEPATAVTDDILQSIATCDHFVPILTPGAAPPLAVADDPFRREIAHALEHNRSVVPLMAYGFTFDDFEDRLKGKLEALLELERVAVHVPPDDLEKPISLLRGHLSQGIASDDSTTVPARPEGFAGQEDKALEGLPPANQLEAERHFDLGVARQQKDDFNGAVLAYDKAIGSYSDYAQAHYYRGLAYHQQERLERALSDYDRALVLKDDHAGAYHNRGLIHHAQNRIQQALEDYNTAIRLRPDYAPTYNNRANVRVAAGDTTGALTDYRRYLELSEGGSHHRQVEATIEELENAARDGTAPDLPGKGGINFVRRMFGMKPRTQDEANGDTLPDKPSRPETIPAAPPQDELISEDMSKTAASTFTMPDEQTKPLPERNLEEYEQKAKLPTLPDDEDDEGEDTAPTQPFVSPLTPEDLRDETTKPINIQDEDTQQIRGRKLRIGYASDVGSVRNNNQDSVFVFHSATVSVDKRPDFGLFIVADGMGGHSFGEQASAIAVRVVASKLNHSIYLPLLNNSLDVPPVNEALIKAVEAANEQVKEEIADGGTTITAVVMLGDRAHIAHVGDSRAYFVTPDRPGEMEQITRDHSLVQRLIELKQISPEQAPDHPQRNVLYKVLGQGEDVEVDALTRRLQAGTRLMLCSDGLWGVVPESEIASIVRENYDPQDACNKLIALANKRGGSDNISVIIIAMSQG